ncbi:hypothetical protein BH10BAC6_BH10BAC6_01990 [soil metagenome]
MIALAVTAIVLLPILGMVLGIYVVLQRRRGSVDVTDIPLLIAAIMLVSGQALLDWAHTQSGSEFIPGNMAWVAWVRCCSCVIAYAFTRRYFSQSLWSVLTVVCGLAIALNIIPLLLKETDDVRLMLVWIGTISTAAYLSGPSLLMALNNARVASGRTKMLGYGSVVVAAPLFVLYPSVIPVTSSMGSLPGLVFVDLAILAVIVGVVLTRTNVRATIA